LVTAVWYPAKKGETKPHTYATGLSGQAVADAAAAADDGPFPLVVFSHGYGAGATQSIYLTEYLASRGYVVAAPDHNDPVTMLRISGRTGVDIGKYMAEVRKLAQYRLGFPFERYAYRPKELSAVIDRMLSQSASKKSPFAGLIDAGRIGCTGHSMGGYTCLAAIGCRPEHTDKRIRAAVLLSPGVFMWPDAAYRGVSAAAMYMYGQYEAVNRRDKEFDTARAYENTPAPKWLLEVWAGNHFTFASAAVFRRLRPRARQGTIAAQHETINKYASAMFARYLRQDSQAERVLTVGDDSLSRFEFDLGKPAAPRSKVNPPERTARRLQGN